MSLKKTVKGTFLDQDNNPNLDKSNCAMIGIGFDQTASFLKGSRFGPRAILEASRQIEYETPANGKRLDEIVQIHNLGILEFNYPKKIGEKKLYTQTKKMIQIAEKEIDKAVNKNKFLMVFGGDHSTTNATLNSITKKISGKKICWLRFDAHLDLRNALDDNKYSHGSIGRRVHDIGVKQVFVGIRDHISEEEQEFLIKEKIVDDVFYNATQPTQEYEKKLPNWINKENVCFEGELSKKQVEKILSKIDREYLFINIDIDGLDANEFLATGTPMPCGLSWKGMNNLFYAVIEHCHKNKIKIIGFDIVEVFPILKNEKKPYSLENALLSGNEMKAALLAYYLLYWSFSQKN